MSDIEKPGRARTEEHPEFRQAHPPKMPLEGKSEPKLARWFWGAIIVMAMISIGLSLAAFLRSPDTSSGSVVSDKTTPDGELSAGEMGAVLGKANQAALSAAKQRLPQLLDEAYKPVYAAIPVYASYHYSVWGEYAELTAAALGGVGEKLAGTLFKDLDIRLADVGGEIDRTFDTAYLSVVEGGSEPGSALGSVGKLTRAALDDTLKRMVVTVPVRTAATAGGIVAVKASAKIVAKKIAAKLSIKAAAKAGGKWVAAGTGAGTGAAVCSWSGPGAGLCAAAGGVGAWLVADYGIVKLDEYWNRDDFEAELRFMVDEQKEEHLAALERALEARAIEVQKVSDGNVQNHDFTLRELAGGSNAEICMIAANLTAQYEPMRSSLKARSAEAIQDLRAEAEKNRGNLSLDRFATEVIENLKFANRATITKILLSGNLPSDYRADRKVTIHVIIDGKRYESSRTKSTTDEGFSLTLHPEAEVSISGHLSYAVALEQHLRVKWNRYFGGVGSILLTDAIGENAGLLVDLGIGLPISYDEHASDLEEVTVKPLEGEVLALSLQLLGKPLPALKNAPSCP